VLELFRVIKLSPKIKTADESIDLSQRRSGLPQSLGEVELSRRTHQPLPLDSRGVSRGQQKDPRPERIGFFPSGKTK
jgi:hypothetical protein